MQTLLNFLSNPGVSALLGVLLGIGLKGLFDILGERQRLTHESTERSEQRTHEAEMQDKEQQQEAADRRVSAYARFLGMAQHAKYRSGELQHDELRALTESYAEAEMVALSDKVRDEAYQIFSEAVRSYSTERDVAQPINTDDFVQAVREEES